VVGALRTYRHMRANLGAAIVVASLMPATAAHAQSVWGAGATNTTNYNLDSNWGPATSPVAAGQSAVFKNNGKINVNVTAGPIAPDSWTFNANSKSFNISGADVNFSLAGANGGIINKANTGQIITISNNIGETFAGVRVQQTGNSTLILSGANTYTGNTTISAGTLQVTNNSSVGTGNVILDGGMFQADGVSDLKFNNRFRMNAAGGAIDANGVTLTLSGNIVDGAGAGPLTILDTSSGGGGRVIFTGNNTYTGDTTICGCATLQLGTAANSGSMVSAVINEGSFNIVNANTSDITVTNQSGSFMTFRNSSDAGTMKIDNFSGFFGGSSLEFHQTSSAADAVINNHSSTSTTFFNSSTAGNATINNIGAGIGIVEFNNNSTAGSATINNAGHGFVVFNDQTKLEDAKIVNNGAGLVLFNSQSSAGNAAASITNNDQGQVHFSNQSTAGSATITNNDFGVLDFNNHASAENATIVNGSAIGMAFLNQSTAGNAFITTKNNSATFFFDRSDGGTARFETEAGSIVDFSASRGPNSDGRINAGSIAGAGNYYIGGHNTLVAGGNNLSTEVSGVIADNNPCGCTTGRGTLEKVGTGTLILSGTNTYTGGTTITAGTLQLGNGGTTGSIRRDVVDNGTLAFNRSNTYRFNRVISGSGAVQQNGAGTTTLTAVNTYAGPTTISAGTLALSGAGSIANSSGVIANGTFDISGTTAGASIKTLSGTGIVTLGNQTLTLTDASGSFAGAIGGNGGLVKQGAGLFTLSGTNTYAGPTTVADGNLRVNGSVASAVNVQSGATLSGTGSIGGLVTVQSGGSLSAGQSPGTLTLGALNLNAGSTSIFELGSPGVVGGATNDLVNVTGNLTLGGTLSVNAPSAGYYRLFNYGTLTASSFDTVNGSSNGTPTVLTNVPNQVNLSIAAAGQRIQFWDGADQTGNGVVNGGAGTWNAANTNWTGAPGQAGINDSWRSSVGVFAGTAGTVTIAGAQAFDTLQFSTTGYVLNAGAGGQLQLAGLSGTGTINTDSGVVTTIGAPIVNGSSQSLTKVGGGTLILTGANTYSGGTTISAGTLQIGNGGTTGSIVGNVTDNSVLAFNRSNALTFDGVISGTGAVNQTGTGTTTLTADNKYTGGTTISAGALQLGNGGATGSIVGNVLNNGVLAVNRSNALALDSVISGSGALNQMGGGTTTLTAANTYTGATMVTAGTLTIAATGSITSNVTNNATFNNAGVIFGSVGNVLGNLNNSGTITESVGNNATFNNSGTVGTTVNNFKTFNNNAGGVVTGLLDNAAGTTTNAGTLSGGARVDGGNLINNNLVSGRVDISLGGQVDNNSTISGSVSNSAVFNNNAGGTVSGLLINSALLTPGTTTNAGHLDGGANVTGGTLTTTGTILNGLTNSATVNADGGAINGAIANNAGGTFNIGGTVTSDNIFTNAASATLAIGASGAYTLQGLLTNSGAVTVAGGGQLIAIVGDITNNAGGTITVALGGTVKDDLNNAGVVTNNGAYVANVATNTGNITNAATGSWTGNVLSNAAAIANNGTWTGNVASNTGAIDNNKTWTGTVSNAGMFNNNAGASVSGLLTNTAGTTTNSGSLKGGANITGGTLNTNAATSIVAGGLTNSATVDAAGAVNGAIANNAGTFNVTGALTSDSTFTNAAAAALAIGGAGAYTLQGLLTNSGAITVAGGGQLIATVGGITNNAGGTITVAQGGTVKDDLNNAGVVTNNGAYVANVASNTGAGSITNAATGSWTGNVLSNAATIANNGGWTGNVVSNTGSINNNLTWTGTVSNAGTFNNNAGATVSGLLTNTAGTTVNNGALNGGANVSGGMFTGSGSVTNLTVSGGIFAPGNGTPGSSMTAAGNLAFQSGAMYLVVLNPTVASFANVGGTASLNGTAAAVYLAGNYVSKKYTILTAAGGVSGTFGSIVNTNVPANFTSTLSYNANNAYIDLTLNFVPNPAPNFGSGLNINQQNVANTLVNFFNSTGGIPAVFGSLSPKGLTLASGELATAPQQTTFEAMNLFLGLLTDPFVAGRGDGFAPPTGAPQFAEENDATNAYAANGKPRSKSEREAYAAIYRKASIRDTYDPRWSVWTAGYGGSQTTDGNTVLGSNNTRSSIGGVAVGADYRFSPYTIAGFAVAGGGTSFSVNGLGSGRSDLFQAGAFVRHTVGPAYFSAALAYGWQDVTTDRTITIAGSDLLRANFNANTFSGRAEGGYRFVAPWIGGVGIAPYAAGQFTTIDLPAYAEQAIAGANTFALTYASKSVTDTRSELGIRTDKSYPMQNGIFTLRGRAAWAHDFNPDRNIAATFQTLPGASFVVNGAAQASDAALVTGSAEMKWLNGFSLAATFEGEFSNVTRSYAGKGVARYAW
jgi:fibronectin-binding autotransporter adhesin